MTPIVHLCHKMMLLFLRWRDHCNDLVTSMIENNYFRILIEVLKTAVWCAVWRKKSLNQNQELLTQCCLKRVVELIIYCSTDTRFHDREILEHETPLGQRYSADCAGHPGQGSAAGPPPARLSSRVQTRTSSSFVLQGKCGYDGCFQQAILKTSSNGRDEFHYTLNYTAGVMPC